MAKLYNFLFYNPLRENTLATDIGLLIIRLGFGGFMLFGHGLGKLMSFSQASAQFPDPLGIGHQLSMALMISAEFFASIAIILGFMTRFTAIPLIIGMSVAGFIIHASDPFKTKELALIYLMLFASLMISGPGRFSLDAIISKALAGVPLRERSKNAVNIGNPAKMESFV
jgi:putative oxidoreductase